MAVQQWTGVVHRYVARNAAEMSEGTFHASEPGGLAFVGEGGDIAQVGVVVGGEEEVDGCLLAIGLDRGDAEVDLHLFAWWGFETQGGAVTGGQFGAVRATGARDGAQADDATVDASEFLAHDVAVASALLELLPDPVSQIGQFADALRVASFLGKKITPALAQEIGSRELAPLKKTIYSLRGLREVLLGCNQRYLAFLSSLDDPVPGNAICCGFLNRVSVAPRPLKASFSSTPPTIRCPNPCHMGNSISTAGDAPTCSSSCPFPQPPLQPPVP